MKQHIEKIWGWDAAFQENIFEKNLAECDTFILANSGQKTGYLQVQSIQPEKPLTLSCFKVNQAAYDFYIKAGFEASDTNEHFFLDGVVKGLVAERFKTTLKTLSK